MIITKGGVAWVDDMIISMWKDSGDHSLENLRCITLAMLPKLNGIADQIGIQHDDYLADPYLLEFCVLRYDPVRQCNVFYQIASSSSYNIVDVVVDGWKWPCARIYGGIDFDIVQEYFVAHPVQTAANYQEAVRAAYRMATSEKIGGSIVMATNNKGNIQIESYPLEDIRPIRECSNMHAHNIIGQQIEIHCPDVNGGMMQVQIDRTGFFQYNGRNYFQSDRGGRIGQDAHWGIFGGTKDLFSVTDNGYVHPTFAGPNNTIKLDDEGFPLDTNFLLGIDGDAYFRGHVAMKSGSARGVFEAQDFKLPNGDSFVSILSQDKKISGDYIDAKGINVKDNNDDTVFYIDATGIHWTPKHSPFKSQFSTSASGPWHDTQQTNDTYKRESTDGGKTWGAAYQYVGQDGKDGAPGSDANVPSYIKSTYIDATSVSTFHIKANKIEAVCPRGAESDTETGFILTGAYDDMSLRYLRMHSFVGGNQPFVSFSSPSYAHAYWNFPATQFRGNLDFSFADNVTGLYYKFS